MGGMKERGSGGGFQGTEFVSGSKDTNKTVYENGNVYVSITCDIYVYTSLTLFSSTPSSALTALRPRTPSDIFSADQIVAS